jgi:3-deoxy-D-manno-octulosonic-acid transferase
VVERGLSAVRRSDLPGARDRSAVIILDTVGELAQLYRVATVVFVGGSLVPTGGHNMLEPALLRKAILFGPHTGNFRESADVLLAAGGAVLVREGAELGRRVGQLLGDLELRQRMGEAAFHAVVGRQGAVKHTLELVERFLMEPAHG